MRFKHMDIRLSRLSMVANSVHSFLCYERKAIALVSEPGGNSRNADEFWYLAMNSWAVELTHHGQCQWTHRLCCSAGIWTPVAPWHGGGSEILQPPAETQPKTSFKALVCTCVSMYPQYKEPRVQTPSTGQTVEFIFAKARWAVREGRQHLKRIFSNKTYHFITC